MPAKSSHVLLDKELNMHIWQTGYFANVATEGSSQLVLGFYVDHILHKHVLLDLVPHSFISNEVLKMNFPQAGAEAVLLFHTCAN